MLLLSKMCKEGMPLDVITFIGAMSACKKDRQWKKGLSLQGEMRKVDVTFNVISVLAAISACKQGMQ